MSVYKINPYRHAFQVVVRVRPQVAQQERIPFSWAPNTFVWDLPDTSKRFTATHDLPGGES